MRNNPFYLQKDNIFAVPILHYNMEMAAHVRLVFDAVKPDCVAVELAETMQLQILHAASRLPDISVVITYGKNNDPISYLVEPCDGAFEALRSALENQIPAFCIDLDINDYPNIYEPFPDPYAINRIGFKNYYHAYEQTILSKELSVQDMLHQDRKRELHMAKRLKELSLQYDRILFVGGMFHVKRILKLLEKSHFSPLTHAKREAIQLCTLTDISCREVMAEAGWFTSFYEKSRDFYLESLRHTEMNFEGEFFNPLFFPPDRQKLIYQLYKEAAINYTKRTGNAFAGYHMRNIMKFARNYALIYGQLMPNLFQILTAAKGSVDDNYAYEVWELATEYSYRRNIDNLPELDLKSEDIWGQSKKIRFQLKTKSKKGFSEIRKRKDKQSFRFQPPGPFSICSYPPEDLIVERFGGFLQKKGMQLLEEEGARIIPFLTSIEDGIDTRETIRHWHEKKIYVKVKGKPPGDVGSVVVIFDEDKPQEGKSYQEKYSWHTCWHGEHKQESDMAFYATPLAAQVIGPGISRCEYGGFMMSYPPRRLRDVWSDTDYQECRSKAEVLLMAAIDYAIKPLIVYMAASPPRSIFKSYAKHLGKKLVYLPIGQLSPITLNKVRVFHVLDGHDRRTNAEEYID